MIAGAPISYWIGFHAVILVLIVCDLAVVNRRSSAAPARRSVAFVLLLLTLAAAFCAALGFLRGRPIAMEFASGYLIELSLSVDNLFVFLAVFRAFGLGLAEQKTALLYGVVGAILMRGLFIFGGIVLLRRLEWVQFVFGALILVGALRLWRERKEAGAQRVWIERLKRYGSGKPGRVFMIAILAVEMADVVFALDSVPAVLAVTRDPFVAYTSNILAILGLRSLYVLLRGLLGRLRYLHYGLAAILAFVGFKMITSRWIHISTALSLGILVLAIATATAVSLLHPERKQRRLEVLH